MSAASGRSASRRRRTIARSREVGVAIRLGGSALAFVWLILLASGHLAAEPITSLLLAAAYGSALANRPRLTGLLFFLLVGGAGLSGDMNMSWLLTLGVRLGGYAALMLLVKLELRRTEARKREAVIVIMTVGLGGLVAFASAVVVALLSGAPVSPVGPWVDQWLWLASVGVAAALIRPISLAARLSRRMVIGLVLAGLSAALIVTSVDDRVGLLLSLAFIPLVPLGLLGGVVAVAVSAALPLVLADPIEQVLGPLSRLDLGGFEQAIMIYLVLGYTISLAAGQVRRNAADLIKAEARFGDALAVLHEAFFRFDPVAGRLIWHFGLDRLFGPTIIREIEAYLAQSSLVPSNFIVDAVSRPLPTGDRRWGRLLVRGGDLVIGLNRPTEPTSWWLLRLHRDQRAATRHVVGSVLDMSAQRALERANLRRARLDAVRDTARGLAHDYRNALSNISFGVAMLRTTTGAADARALSAIEAASSDIARLTTSLAFLSRDGRSSDGLSRLRAVDVKTELDALQPIIQQLLGASHDLRVTIEASPQQRSARLDPAALATALLGLASGLTEHFVAAEDIDLRLQWRARLPTQVRPRLPSNKSGYLIISWLDRGVTWPRRYRQQLVANTAIAGDETILATVAAAVRSTHGAILTIPGRNELGLCFPVMSKPPFGGSAGYVLMVDDDEALLQMTATALRRSGHRVLTAVDVGEAIGHLETHDRDIAILVTDLVLPRLSGRTLIELVRAQRPDLPVVVFSGFLDDEMRDYADGRTRLLEKPASPAKLAAVIRDLLPT